MKSLKNKELKKVSFLERKICLEEKKMKKLRSEIILMTSKEKSLQNDLIKIRIDLFDIDFTLKDFLSLLKGPYFN